MAGHYPTKLKQFKKADAEIFLGVQRLEQKIKIIQQRNFRLAMENNLPNNFLNLLLALQYKKTYQRSLAMAKQKFYIKQINIEDLTPFKVLELYRTINKKFYMNRTKITEGSWFQNELRVYLWLLIGYVFIHKKSIHQMTHDDWNYFSPIFHQRPPISFQFQAFSLVPVSRSPKWSSNEIELLQNIIKQKKFKNKWNSIARQLFIRSNRQHYRTPKQCRERWFNYLDPAKKKSGWDKAEDLVLLKTVLHQGKKWSTVVRILKNTRTEHTVKNRFKSMVAIEKKKHPLMEENQIVNKLIRQLEKELYDSRESNIPSSVSNSSKIQYSDNSTQNQGVKQDNVNKTASDYAQNMPGYVNVSFIRNKPGYFIQPPMFQGIQMMSYVQSVGEPFQPKSPTKSIFHNSDAPDQNQFLMSNQDIDNYMSFDGKEKESMMKEELMEYKAGEVNEVSQYMQKGDKINYFDEQFHECFH